MRATQGPKGEKISTVFYQSLQCRIQEMDKWYPRHRSLCLEARRAEDRQPLLEEGKAQFGEGQKGSNLQLL